jgi:hypothetical protein
LLQQGFDFALPEHRAGSCRRFGFRGGWGRRSSFGLLKQVGNFILPDEFGSIGHGNPFLRVGYC